MPNSDHRSKITVEDLLHLKRAERPAAEFWSGFDRELRQKQLAALLEKRPWWQSLPELLVRHAYLPIGATAILALTLVSAKYSSPFLVTQTAGAAADSAAAPVLPEKLGAAPLVSNPVSSALINRNNPEVKRTDDRAAVSVNVRSSSDVAVGQAISSAAPSRAELPSALSIAANLAHLEQSQPELINSVLGSRLSSPARVQVASVPMVELASLSANSSRRSRLLANYTDRQLSPAPTAPDIVRERLSRSLGDGEITDRISRIGLKGDQLSLGLTLRL